jgi:anti-sigma-K factor RskA
MNVKEYIESGILELYILGVLPEAQREEVDAYATQYDEIRSEIDRLEATLITYAQSNAVPVTTKQKSNILDEIDTFQNSVSSTGFSSSFSTKWIWILSALLVLAVGSMLFLLLQQQTTRHSLETAQAELAQQIVLCDSIQSTNEVLNQKINVLLDPRTEATRMNQEESEIYAVLYRNKETQIAYLDVNQLPTPPSGKQYQFWYISDGVPQSIGIFELQAALLTVDFVEQASAFAISLENRGGSETPTDIRFVGQV